MKLKEFSESFLTLWVETENKPSQQKSAREGLRNWLIPYLGDMDLDEISAFDLAKFRNTMVRKGLAPATINKNFKLLSKMFSCAIEWRQMKTSPPKIPYMKQSEPDVAFLQEEEVRQLEAAIGSDEPWRTMVFLALRTGLRVGELRALQWDAVDLKARTVRIRQATWSHTMEVVETKSRKARSVPLDHETASLLGSLKRFPRSGNYVFTHDGGLLTYDDCLDTLARYVEAAGLPRGITWKTFRHTFGSHVAMSGESLRTLQTLMGHASIHTTMRYYAHLSPDAGHKVVETLARRYKNPKTP